MLISLLQNKYAQKRDETIQLFFLTVFFSPNISVGIFSPNLSFLSMFSTGCICLLVGQSFLRVFLWDLLCWKVLNIERISIVKALIVVTALFIFMHFEKAALILFFKNHLST